MSRRVDRAMKRLERIHVKRLTEQAERIRQCVQRDACDHYDCQYFALPEDVAELIEFASAILSEEMTEHEQPGG